MLRYKATSQNLKRNIVFLCHLEIEFKIGPFNTTIIFKTMYRTLNIKKNLNPKFRLNKNTEFKWYEQGLRVWLTLSEVQSNEKNTNVIPFPL